MGPSSWPSLAKTPKTVAFREDPLGAYRAKKNPQVSTDLETMGEVESGFEPLYMVLQTIA